MRYKTFDIRLSSLLQSAQSWEQKLIGYSEGGRPIIAFTHKGEGPAIMAWSLMHGNEPTGYESLLQFMSHTIQGNWCIIPILNPDGAEAFTRNNGLGIDVNRDARDQISAEAKALEVCRVWYQPEVALNLHDQRPRFYPSGGILPASFSLLAPKGHPEFETKSQRIAQQILHHWAKQIDLKYPKQIARFDDSFYPNAFGEYFQESGCATITLETGIAPGDWARAGIALTLKECLIALDTNVKEWQQLETRSAYLTLPKNVNLANEWVIQYPGGQSHLRLHEEVEAGEYKLQWEVDVFTPNQPIWFQSVTTTSLEKHKIGEILSEAYLTSIGLTCPELGLRN